MFMSVIYAYLCCAYVTRTYHIQSTIESIWFLLLLLLSGVAKAHTHTCIVLCVMCIYGLLIAYACYGYRKYDACSILKTIWLISMNFRLLDAIFSVQILYWMPSHIFSPVHHCIRCIFRYSQAYVDISILILVCSRTNYNSRLLLAEFRNKNNEWAQWLWLQSSFYSNNKVDDDDDNEKTPTPHWICNLAKDVYLEQNRNRGRQTRCWMVCMRTRLCIRCFKHQIEL